MCNICIIVCSVGVRSLGYLNWTCANVLESSGDTYSNYGAKAFKNYIEEINGIHNKSFFSYCSVGYTSGSKDMKNTIEQLISNMNPAGCACKVNVVFAQHADLAQLFLEADNKGYKGEWVVGDTLLGSLADMARKVKQELQQNNKKDSSVDEILRGMFKIMRK